VTGRTSAGQRGAVQNVYTGNYAYGQRGATYNPTTGVSARGGSATVGNVGTGQQQTARWGQVAGPGGQTARAAQVGNYYYADHDGNVYKNTGSGWQKYDNNGWNSVQDERQTQSLISVHPHIENTTRQHVLSLPAVSWPPVDQACPSLR